jgi:hypothetical protein
VDQALGAERFGADHEPLATKRPQAGDGSDQPARVSVDRRERRAVGEPRFANRRATAEQSG